MDRNLDGARFPIVRDGKQKYVSFSDMTGEERKQVLRGMTEDEVRQVAITLAECLRMVGDQFDIVGGAYPEKKA